MSSAPVLATHSAVAPVHVPFAVTHDVARWAIFAAFRALAVGRTAHPDPLFEGTA